MGALSTTGLLLEGHICGARVARGRERGSRGEVMVHDLIGSCAATLYVGGGLGWKPRKARGHARQRGAAAGGASQLQQQTNMLQGVHAGGAWPARRRPTPQRAAVQHAGCSCPCRLPLTLHTKASSVPCMALLSLV